MADERDELDEVLNGPIVLYFDVDVERRRELLARARSIRARERKLAELAREMYRNNGITDPRAFDRAYSDWTRKYDDIMNEAIK